MRSLKKDIKSGSRFQDERQRCSQSNIFLSPVPHFRLAEIIWQKDNEDKNEQKQSNFIQHQ